MASIFPGRYTAQFGESFVVFLIGMRIPRFGMAQAGEHVRAVGRLEGARSRMGRAEAE
ncbi:MAG: hypothetical protein ACRD3N_14795 [Terracidiphilus sp.]